MAFQRTTLPQKGNCFVMMPFGKKEISPGVVFDWDDHYKEVLDPTIRDASMVPFRALDIFFGGEQLLDRLWRGIQEAEIVIADLTGRSPNVLYEVGVAHVIGKRLLLLTMSEDDIPVDLRGLNHIPYSVEGRGLLQFTKALGRFIDAARRQPAAEATLKPLPLDDDTVKPIPAKVLSVSERFVTVVTDNGKRGFLNAEDISWTKVHKDLRKLRWLEEGKILKGAMVTDLEGEPKYSLIALESNPWPSIEAGFPVGTEFRGRVVKRAPGIGAFVEVRNTIHGLIPEGQLPSGVHDGSLVKAKVVRVDTERREILLRFLELLQEQATVHDGWGPFFKGQQFEGKATFVEVEKGFVLVHVENGDKPVTGMLHNSKMSAEMRRRFLAGELRSGDYIAVEVISVDGERQRLGFRDRVPLNGSADYPTHAEAASAN